MTVPSAPVDDPIAHPFEGRQPLSQLRGNRAAWVVAAGALVIGAVLFAVHSFTLDRLLADTAAADQRTLDVYAAGIVGTLDRYPRSVVLLAQDPRLRLALRPEAPDIEGAAELLSKYAALSGAESVFLLDRDGQLVAASSAAPALPDVVRWFAASDAYSAADTGRLGRAFGATPVGSDRRYYYARRLRVAEETVGVLVVAVAVDELELLWQLAEREVLVVDREGIVVLSSQPAWRLRSANRDAVAPLPFTLPPVDGCGAAFKIDGDGRLCQASRIHHLEWDVYLLSPTGALVRQAALVTLEVALGLLSAALMAGVAWQRLTLKERTNRALQGRVEARTAQLQAANNHLRQEIHSRIAKEEELHQAQDELVQAGKMAALGQMAAGLVHELNQPLAAMRTYNDNTAKLLLRDQAEAAGKNVGLMQELIERMASISSQLKRFAQRTPLRLEPVDVGPAINSAIRLIEDTTPAARIQIVLADLPTQVVAAAEPVRLQQVLVNLIRNAVDAIGEAVGQVTVTVSDRFGELAVQVTDNGPGIPPGDLARVFDPFFTTKPGGRGMGLGLSVTQRITKDFDGRIWAENRPHGGTCFTFTLRRWTGDMP